MYGAECETNANVSEEFMRHLSQTLTPIIFDLLCRVLTLLPVVLLDANIFCKSYSLIITAEIKNVYYYCIVQIVYSGFNFHRSF